MSERRDIGFRLFRKKDQQQTEQPRTEDENHGTPQVERSSGREATEIVRDLLNESRNIKGGSLADFALADVKDLREREQAADRVNSPDYDNAKDISRIRSRYDTLLHLKVHSVMELRARHPEEYGDVFAKVEDLANRHDRVAGQEATNNLLGHVKRTIRPNPQSPQQ